MKPDYNNTEEFEDIESDDDVYTIKEFLENVSCGGFIDSDGCGVLANQEAGKKGLFWDSYDLKPSTARFVIGLNPWATHVVWYNK